jgi:hypothetical protein
MEFDKKLTKEEKDFLDYMGKRGFIFTYYQAEDKNAGGSIGGFKVDVKNLLKIKN